MSRLTAFKRTLAGAVAATAGAVLLAASPHGQQAALLLLVDRDGITAGRPPHDFTTQDLNVELAAVGMRDGLPFFLRNLGQTVTLPAGNGTNPGWLTLTSVPETWASPDAPGDGLSNFVLAGPGLGSPEESGDRTRLLRSAGVRALTLDDLRALRQRSICGLIFEGDVAPAQAGADLSGRTLGVVGLRIVDVVPGVDASSAIAVEILDSTEVCQDSVGLFQSN